MQLTAATRRCQLLVLAGLLLLAPGRLRADANLDLGTSFFHESGGPLYMNVTMPAAEASVDLAEPITVGVSWNADIVSGASVAVVDAPATDVDAISAASVTDARHEFAGTVTLRDGTAAVDLTYRHAFEHDYLSNGFSVGARTELFERNTGLSISYARGFDHVCDVAGTFEPPMKPRLDSSKGCFEDEATRGDRSLDVHTWQGGWTQAWTPFLTMQLTATAQLLHGFQSNPYRAVRIGKTSAQEHHPENRARYALGGGVRLWVAPLSGALQADARIYRDTWDISSITAELAYEQTLVGSLRLRARGRYYTQTAAAFYSDDYVLDPKGSYFTGDRELSAMQSGLLGGQVVWSALPNDEGEVFGFLSGFQAILKADVLKTFFDDFHYDRAEVPNTFAIIGSLEVRATF
ncbi:MAG TPA: DUF3570 domain-containing protein [Polyangiales bacterium]|nr:DUF3570 domain-containing protein [Polyangiales bacterium]